MLYGAWRVGKDVRTGQRFLAAAWAFMCGMAYLSFFGQLHRLSIGEHDPAPIPSAWVAVIKGVGLVLGVLATTFFLGAPRSRNLPGTALKPPDRSGDTSGTVAVTIDEKFFDSLLGTIEERLGSVGERGAA